MTTDTEALVAAVAHKYDDDDGEGEALTRAALRRLQERSRHGGKGCSGCGETKALSAFGPGSSRGDGLSHRCRLCDSSRKRAGRRSV